MAHENAENQNQLSAECVAQIAAYRMQTKNSLAAYNAGTITTREYRFVRSHNKNRIAYIKHEGVPIPDGKDVCDNCMKLEDCSFTERVLSRSDSMLVCEDCAEAETFICDHCGERHLNDERTHVTTSSFYRTHNEEWCESCVRVAAYRCADCGEYYALKTTSYLSGSSCYNGEFIRICDNCADEWAVCASCGCVIRWDDAYCVESGWITYYYCPGCYESAHSDALQEYGHTYATSKAQFHSTGAEQNTELFLGVELETEATHTEDPYALAEAICNAVGDNILECKEDASLNFGCEIALFPCTPHYLLYTNTLKRVISAAKAEGATSHDNGNCGLHVHISNRALGDYGPYILHRLINTHVSFWDGFSRRTRYEIDQWATFDPVCSPAEWTEAEKQDYGYFSSGSPVCNADLVRYWEDNKPKGRYHAVNTMPYDTTELRLFRGSLNLVTVRATIEAVAGIGLYAAQLSEEICAWGTEFNGLYSMSDIELCELIVSTLMENGLPWAEFLYYCSKRELVA